MKTNAITNENNGENPDAALRQKIKERSYHIWLGNGSGHGDHERHWLQAERELMETAKQERERRPDVLNAGKSGKSHKSQS